MKLLCMLRVLMKVVWLTEMMLFMCGARCRARALAIIFMNEWIKLIGLKSLILVVPSFFGSSTMFAGLMSCKLEHLGNGRNL